MSIFSKGIVLPQHKEPALSHNLVRFINPQPDSLVFTREIPLEPELLTPEDLIDIAAAAKIVDEKDGKPLYRKLRRALGPAAGIVVDAVDDEPYVSSKLNPLLKLREEVLGGIALCQRVAVAPNENVRIMVYKHLADTELTLPGKMDEYKIDRVRGGYPAIPSISQIRRMGRGTYLTVGVGAVIHFYRAVMRRKRQTTTFITAAGNAVANPMNMEVSLGMNVTQVLERCGLSRTPTRVVSGGSMTGFSLLDTDKTLITHTTRAVLAFQESRHERMYSCIGCGRCERACPSGLNPMYLHRFVQSHNFASLEYFDAHLCIGCGTCSYVCPSRLDLVGSTLSARDYANEHRLMELADERAKVRAADRAVTAEKRAERRKLAAEKRAEQAKIRAEKTEERRLQREEVARIRAAQEQARREEAARIAEEKAQKKKEELERKQAEEAVAAAAAEAASESSTGEVPGEAAENPAPVEELAVEADSPDTSEPVPDDAVVTDASAKDDSDSSAVPSGEVPHEETSPEAPPSPPEEDEDEEVIEVFIRPRRRESVEMPPSEVSPGESPPTDKETEGESR